MQVSAETQSQRVPAGSRLVIAIAIAGASMLLFYVRLGQEQVQAADFTWAWRGAALLLQGINPYDAIRPSGPYPYNDNLYYPLPALLVAAPLSFLTAETAALVFIGFSSGMLAYHICGDGFHRLLVFASASYLYAAYTIQWSPLTTAAAFVPLLAPALLTKPNIGLPILIAYPGKTRFALIAVTIALSLVIMPNWPLEWYRSVPSHINYIPLLSLYAPFAVLPLLRWRSPNARLILAMSVMPQRLLYDQVALWLVPASPRQSIGLLAANWAGAIAGLLLNHGEFSMTTTYIAAALVVYLQSREQPVPKQRVPAAE